MCFEEAVASYGLFFFAAAIIRNVGCGEKLMEHCTKFFRTFAANGVVHPFALFPSVDNSGIAEDLHVMGQGRLADVQCIQQFTGTHFSIVKELQNPNPVLIT